MTYLFLPLNIMTKPSLSDFSDFVEKPKPVIIKSKTDIQKTNYVYEYNFSFNCSISIFYLYYRKKSR